MSTILSASPVIVDIEHSSDHSDTPKSFTRESSSSPSSSPSSSSSPTNTKKQDLCKHQVPDSPPRPSAPEPSSPEPSFNANASTNGHAPELNEEEIPQVPSQAPSQIRDEQPKAERGEHGNRVRDESPRDEQGSHTGSDLEEDIDPAASEGDAEWTQEEYESDMRRVKVYELVGQKWTDRGTAFCQGDYDEEVREAKLVARAEQTEEILLQCIIRANDVYQRQQDTLIVWTEPDGTDFALSFQDIDGCTEVWDFISEVQRHLHQVEEDPESSEAGSSSMHMFSAGSMNPLVATPKLPTPTLGNMQECERVIKQLTRQPRLKEKLTDLIIMNHYVKQIIDIMHQAEDLEDIRELHACCTCMQAILLINDIVIYDYILQDSMFMGVIGVLEYDPEFPQYKALYREFLQNSARFREPIPIRDPQLRTKIHHTYRLQLLKDFILARATDDATFNILNSSIAFNQVDICNSIGQDDRFLRELVGLFLSMPGRLEKEPLKRTDKGKEKEGDPNATEKKPNEASEAANGEPSSPEIGPQPASGNQALPSNSSEEYTMDARRKDGILLIQQLCLMGKNIQLPARMQLFRTLVDRGILHTIQWALGRSDPVILGTAGEILGIILDHDVIGVRQHVMRQVAMSGRPAPAPNGSVGSAEVVEVMEVLGAQTRKETLLDVLCQSLITGHDQAFRSQMADAIRTVLEVPQLDGTDSNAGVMRNMARTKDDPVTERFVEFFYQKCCETLFKPLTELPESHKLTERKLRLSRDRSNLYLYLCDLLTAFLLQHSFRSHFFVITHTNTLPPLIPRIASLLRAKEKHVRLASLRFFRACLKLGNRNIFVQLMKHEAFLPILELTAQEALRDNLLSSCCQEFFEHIRRVNTGILGTSAKPDPQLLEAFKELLAHIMTKYGAAVRELAQSPVCGERFQNLIRRWEINNEPPPPKEVETITQPTAPAVRKWGQGRLLDAEEEEYFNNSDDEDTLKRGSSNVPISPLGSVGLKRKRGKGFTTAALGRSPKQLRPLVDYEDEDEDEKVEETPKIASSSKTAGDQPVKQVNWFAGLHDNDLPPSPTLPKGPTVPSQSPLDKTLMDDSPPRLGEKRRRDDEDDEDEMLERLVRNKRPTVEKEEAKSSPKFTTGKMKLKLGSTTFSLGLNPQKKDAKSGG